MVILFKTWLMRFSLGGLSYLLLFWRLGEGDFELWDEGLYGQLARNAIETDRYLFAVDDQAAFSQLFSKPPLSIWSVALAFRLLGYSLFSLRIPFALSSLGIVATVYFWGRRMGGEGLGGLWAFCTLIAAGTFRWGRTATIEPMFVFWGVLALYAYGGAVGGRLARRRTGFVVLATFALSCAFLTKQLATALVIFPIIAYETMRRDSLRQVATRLLATVGVASLVFLAWFTLSYREVGFALIDRFFLFSIVKRMDGLVGLTHLRTLNRVAGYIASFCAPLPWVVGLLGVGAWSLAADRTEPDRKPSEVWLLLWLTVGATLIYGNLTKSLLPWYIYVFVPPITGGCAWLLFCLLRAGPALVVGEDCHASQSPTAGPFGTVVATLGGVCLVLTVVSGASRIASQTNAAVGLSLFLPAAVYLGGAASRRYFNPVRLARLAQAVCLALLLFAGTTAALRHPAHGRGPERYGVLMEAFGDAGVDQVYFDPRFGLIDYQWRTFFGPRARATAQPPWSKLPAGETYAYAVQYLLPREYKPPAGVALIRSSGVSGFLIRSPAVAWGQAQLAELLEAGPITYEAEDFGSGLNESYRTSADASGGALRAARPWRNERLARHVLSSGPHDIFPAGRYTAGFWLAWDCDGYDYQAAHLEVQVGSQVMHTKPLSCKGGERTPLSEVPVHFTIDRPAPLTLRVVYERGRVLHDRTVVARRGGLLPRRSAQGSGAAVLAD